MAVHLESDIRKLKQDPDVKQLVDRMLREIDRADNSPSPLHLILIRHRVRSIRGKLDALLKQRYGISADDIERQAASRKLAITHSK